MKKGRKNTKYLLAAAVLLMGCHAPEPVNTPKELPRQQLVLWSYFETEAQRSGLDNLLKGFNQSQTEYELSWQYIPMTDFDREFSRSYTEQDLPDMVLIDNPDMLSFIRMGVFEDITQKIQNWNMQDEYYTAAVETVQMDGRYYGIPFVCNNLGLIYNNEMLEEVGLEPPKNWEEFQQTAAALTTEERSGFLMCGIASEQGAFQIIPWILGSGEVKENIGGKKTEMAYEFLGELASSGSMSQDCINLSQTDVARKFIEGKTAMMENGPWILPMLKKAGISYGITRLPVSEQEITILGGENIGIVKGKNVDGALAFLQYCQKGNVMNDFCLSTGSLPARRENMNALIKQEPELQVFAEQMEYAIPRTSIPDWNILSEALTTNFYSVISGEKTAGQAAESLKKKN